MPAVEGQMLNQGAHGNGNGSRCSVMQRIHSLEGFIKKVCFQRNWDQEMEAVMSSNSVNYKKEELEEKKKGETEGVPCSCVFQMPLHYPRYSKADYEEMAEWKLDILLKEYGLPIMGDVQQKRSYAIGAFLWPDQI